MALSIGNTSNANKLKRISAGYVGVTWTARDSNRNWDSVASSSDGGRLVAGVYGGQLYTSTYI